MLENKTVKRWEQFGKILNKSTSQILMSNKEFDQ